LSRFEELRSREAAHTAILYAFDLIEHNGEDMHNLPFLDRKAALSRLLRDTEAGILLNEHVADDGPTVFAHACRLGARGRRLKEGRQRLPVRPCRVWIKVRNPGSIAVRRERSPIWLERTICSEGLCGSKTPTVYQRTVLEGRQFDVRPRTEMRSE
jgi:hypothetical protein